VVADELVIVAPAFWVMVKESVPVEPVEIVTLAELRAVLISLFEIVDVALAVKGLVQVVPPDVVMVILKGSSNQLPALPKTEPAFMSILSTFKKYPEVSISPPSPPFGPALT